MAFSYNKKNLANTTITGAITPTQTSVTVADATVFSYAFFYATLMPSNEMSNASNSEIVLVTNIQGNTLTLVRGQENTIARSFPYGAVITNGIYTRDIDYARSIGRKVFMARDDGTDDTNTSYQINDPMIKNVPEEGSIITVEFDVPSYGAPTLGVNNGIGGLVQVSGTDIHITDSSGQIDSVEMYGDTEQTTYSGKNKLTSTSHLVSSDNGITVSLQSDGSIKATGTVGSSWNGFNLAFYNTDTIPSGQYTFSIDHSISSAIAVAFRTSDNSNLGNITIPAGSTSATGTISGAIGKSSLWVSATTGTSINFTIKAQLELGSTATSFEPYVGGTASPNPDYPQEVQTVTGRQVVTITDGGSESQEYEINLGKNLYEGSPSFNAFSGISAWEDGGTYNGMPVIKRAAAWSGAYRLININAGVTYTFSSWVKSDEARQVAIYAIGSGATATITPNNKNITTSTSWERVSFTFTCSTSGTVALRFENTSASTTNYTYISGYQLELGSTATTYAPYVTAFGKNLLNPATLTADSRLNVDGTVLSGATGFSTSDYIPVEPNTTYTITRNAASSGFFGNLCQYNSSKALVGTREYWDNLASYWPYHITTSSTTRYIRVSDQTTLFGTSFQIERGSTATTYEPNMSGQLELCKIGTYQDYIYKSGEDWYVHKETGKVTFTGAETETWSSATAATGYVRFSTASRETHADNNGYCNELINRGSQSHGAYEYVWVQPNANAFYIQVLNTRANNLSSFRTWLGANPATVYYDIATPTDTQITNATLIAQLNALYNMLPEGVADVVVTGDLPGSLTIKYYQQGTGAYTAPIVGGAEIDGGDNEQVVELDSYLPYRLVYDTNGYWRVLNKGPKVTTGAIADKAVTTAKLADDAVTDAQFDWFRTIDYMTVRGTSSSDVSYAAGATIPLDATYSVKSSNTAFTNAGHGIKIGAGVSRVMVCAQVFGAYDGITFVYFRLKKNNDTMVESVASIPVNSFSTGFITPMVIEVSQNDVLTLQLIEKVKVRTQATFLSVFKVQ